MLHIVLLLQKGFKPDSNPIALRFALLNKLPLQYFYYANHIHNRALFARQEKIRRDAESSRDKAPDRRAHGPEVEEGSAVQQRRAGGIFEKEQDTLRSYAAARRVATLLKGLAEHGLEKSQLPRICGLHAIQRILERNRRPYGICKRKRCCHNVRRSVALEMPPLADSRRASLKRGKSLAYSFRHKTA